jgi:hypothetical protein
MKLNDADALYIGTEAATAAYLGNVLVWSAGAPACTITLTGAIASLFGGYRPDNQRPDCELHECRLWRLCSLSAGGAGVSD